MRKVAENERKKTLRTRCGTLVGRFGVCFDVNDKEKVDEHISSLIDCELCRRCYTKKSWGEERRKDLAADLLVINSLSMDSRVYREGTWRRCRERKSIVANRDAIYGEMVN